MTATAGRRDGPDRHEVRTVAACFTAYGAVFFDRLAPLFLVGAIAADLGAPSAAEGTLALLIGLGWAAAMPVAGFTAQRSSAHRRLVLALLLAAVAAALSVTATSWSAFIVLRGVSGLAAATGSPAVTSLAFTTIPAHRRGTSLGVVQSSPRLLGSLASPVVVTAVAVTAGWRSALLASALVLAASALVFHATLPTDIGREVPATRHTRRPVLRPGGTRQLRVCALASVVLLSWLTIFSQSAVALVAVWQDRSLAAAGAQVGLFGIGAGVAALLVPIASDRLGRGPALAVATVIGGVSGVVLATAMLTGTALPAPVSAGLMVGGGVAMGGLPLVISIVPAETVDHGDVGRALLLPIGLGEGLGAALLPAAAAVVAVHVGGAAVLGIAAAAVLLVGLSSRWVTPATHRPANGRVCALVRQRLT